MCVCVSKTLKIFFLVIILLADRRVCWINGVNMTKDVKRKITKPKRSTKNQLVLPFLKPSLSNKLHVLFIGFNAGEKSALKQHRYAHHTNQFWKLFNESNLLEKVTTSQNITKDDTLEKLLLHGCKPVHDYHLVNYGIGFTSLVERSTKNTLELGITEKLESVPRLLKEWNESNAVEIVILGKGIWDVIVTFFSRKLNVKFKLNAIEFKWGEVGKTHEHEIYTLILDSIHDCIPKSSKIHVFPDTSGLVRHFKYEDKLDLWKDFVHRL